MNQLKSNIIRIILGLLALAGLSVIWGGGRVATITLDGYLDVKTHTPDGCYSKEQDVDRDSFVIVTPPSGKAIEVIQAYAASKSDTDIRIYFTGNEDGVIFTLYPTKKSSALGAIICATGAVDQSISLDCGADSFIQFGYNIIEG